MIELKYITVRNFRSHEEFTFVPLPAGSGMTAIAGPNGAGKSSLIHALMWSLYGTTPDGVNVAALRKEGSTEPVEAQVGFIHEGQHIDICRQIRGIKDTTAARITIDGQLVNETSSRGATTWIRERLGMDSESFSTAFLVKQKSVDSLMTATNTERRRIIERLAGIDRLSTAVQQARRDVRQHEQITQATMPVGNLIEVQTLLTELQTEHLLTKTDILSHETSLTTFTSQNTILHDELDKLRSSEITISLLTEDKRTHESTLDSLTTLLTELPSSPEAGAEQEITLRLTETSSALKEAEIQQQEVLLSTERLSVLAEQLSSFMKEHEHINREIEKMEIEVRALSDQVESGSTIVLDISMCQEDAAEVTRQINVEQHLLNQIEEQIIHLTHSDDTSLCPTCEQTITHKQELIESFYHRQKKTKEKLRELDITSKGLNERLSLLILQQETHSRCAVLVDTCRTKIGEFTRRSTTLSRDITDTKTRLIAQQNVGTQTSQNSERIEFLRTEIRQLEIQRLAVEQARQVALRREKIQQQYEVSRQQLLRIDMALNKIDVSNSITRRKGLEAEVETIREQMSNAKSKLSMLVERDFQLQQRVLNQLDIVRSLEHNVERHAVALHMLEELRHAAGSLEAFRVDRIHQLAPEIGEIASTYLRDITDEAMSEVSFDETFSATIHTQDGRKLTYGQLSGGEAETVSLVLCIAISQTLATSPGGLLFLDEALTAQDSQRRVRALQALRNTQRQVIVINHAVEDQDMVDSLVELSGRS
jgi:exonuclease SbcC